jgi:hypothetical protein
MSILFQIPLKVLCISASPYLSDLSLFVCVEVKLQCHLGISQNFVNPVSAIILYSSYLCMLNICALYTKIILYFYNSYMLMIE